MYTPPPHPYYPRPPPIYIPHRIQQQQTRAFLMVTAVSCHVRIRTPDEGSGLLILQCPTPGSRGQMG